MATRTIFCSPPGLGLFAHFSLATRREQRSKNTDPSVICVFSVENVQQISVTAASRYYLYFQCHWHHNFHCLYHSHDTSREQIQRKWAKEDSFRRRKKSAERNRNKRIHKIADADTAKLLRFAAAERLVFPWDAKLSRVEMIPRDTLGSPSETVGCYCLHEACRQYLSHTAAHTAKAFLALTLNYIRIKPL